MRNTEPLPWQKSRLSQGNGSCVEVAITPDRVFIRDTKLGPDSPVLEYTRAEWLAFLGDESGGVKGGQFDLT